MKETELKCRVWIFFSSERRISHLYLNHDVKVTNITYLVLKEIFYTHLSSRLHLLQHVSFTSKAHYTTNFQDV